MKTGSTVRVVQPVLTGQVVQRRLNPETDAIELLVSYTDGNGEQHQRWFTEADLQEVQP